MSSLLLSADLYAKVGKDHGQLFRQIYQGMDVWKDVSVMANVKNNVRLTSLQIADILRPYTGQFKHTVDAIKFTPREMGVRRLSANLLVNPEDMRDTYLAQFQQPGFLTTPQQLPFAQFVLEDIKKRVATQVNNQVAWLGEYVPAPTLPTPDTRTAADAVDGFKKALTGMITDGDVIPTATGAITDADVIDQILQVYRSIPMEVRNNEALEIYMPTHIREMYEDKLDTLGVNTGRGEDHLYKSTVRGTNGKLKITEASWMHAADGFFITPKWNIKVLADATEFDMAKLKFQDFDYDTKIMLDFAIGFNFATNAIWTSASL